MFDDRSLKLDLCAIALLALALFLGVSLWTYDRTDSPSALVWPASSQTHNACGSAGAYTAHYLLSSLGLGAYYAVGSLAVLMVLLFGRREIGQPVLRTVGWAVSLVGLTTLAALAVPNWTPGPVIGSGGYIGAMGRGLLEMHFARAGAYIFALSVLVAGLLLVSDYVVFRLAAVAAGIAGRSLLQLGHLGHVAAKKKSDRVKTDLEDAAEPDDEEANWDEDEDEDEEDACEEDEEPEEGGADEREIRVLTPADKAETDGEAASATGQSGKRSKHKRQKSALPIKNHRAQPGPRSEREAVIDQLEAADGQADEPIEYELPPLDLLLPADDVCYEEHEKEVRHKAKILEKTFKSFGFNVRVVEIETGPVIAQYEVELEPGLRLSRITGLADDLAIALRVPSVRIVAPIVGKNTVGIEVPNENRQLVRLREVIEETNGRAKRMKIPIYLGKDVAGNPMVVDLAALPHLLIAGRTGTGKSVCLNSIIVSILMGRGPDEVRMLMIDPKMVELNGYRKLPHLMHPVVTDMRKAEAILAWAVDKMEERYQLLSRAGVRHVSVYNQLGDEELRERIEPADEEEWRQIPRQLPYIVIVADELADLMLVAGKEIEQHVIRLAQKSRAVGIHLILATQKPTVDVITGLIKSNLPARIAFQVASRTDSRVVLDEMGAEKLLGNGDMLFLLPGTSTLLRGQGTFLSDDEINRIVDFVGTDEPQFAGELLELKTKEELEASTSDSFQSRDELYETAADIVVRERRGSVSLLQRALGIGYGRAARLIDFMAEDRIVGQYNGSQAREVLISLGEWETMSLGSEGATESAAAGAAASRGVTSGTVLTAAGTRLRRNRIVPGGESDGESASTGDDYADDEWDEEDDDEHEADTEESEDDEDDPEYDEDTAEEYEYEDAEEEDLDGEAAAASGADDEEEGEEDESEDDEEWEEDEFDEGGDESEYEDDGEDEAEDGEHGDDSEEEEDESEEDDEEWDEDESEDDEEWDEEDADEEDQDDGESEVDEVPADKESVTGRTV
jgi:S-DNA-T family DNA segregation ATPase FtsK/SpoIIIE